MSFSFGTGTTTGAPAGGGFSFGSTAPAAGAIGGTGFGGFGASGAGAATGTGFGSSTGAFGGGTGFGAGANTFGTNTLGTGGASAFGTGGASAFGAGGGGLLGAGGIGGGQHMGQQGAIQWPGTQTGIRAGDNPLEKIQQLLAAYGSSGRQGQQSRFQYMLYNKAHPELTRRYRENPTLFQPPNFPQHIWDAANRHNPDPENLIPAAVRSYPELQGRARKHEEGLHAVEGFVAKLEKDLAEMKSKHESTVKKDIASLKQQQVRLTQKLLTCLRKLMARENAPLKSEELTLKRRLQLIHKQLSHPADFTSRIDDLMSSARMNKRARTSKLDVPDEKNMARMLQFLKDQQRILKELMATTQKDMRDLSIISRELSSQVPAATQY